MTFKKNKFCPYNIHWYEGMPLSPHHFQQADTTQEKTLAYLISQTMPYHWGIINIEIDDTKMKEGTLYLNNIEAIFENRTIIFLPSEQNESMAVKFSDHINQSKPTKVFLVKSNLYHTYDSESHDKSYQPIQIESTEDYNTGENSTCVFKLKPIFKIAFDDIPPNHTGIQICSIIDSNMGPKLVKYDAPCIHVGMAKNIITETKRLIKLLKNKTTHIKKQINIKSTKYNPTTINSIFMQGILPVEHIIYSKNTHPQTLFSALINLIAHISIFDTDSIFQEIPLYEHENLFKSFQPLFSFIQNILDNMKDPYILHDFEEQESIFYKEIKNQDEILLLINYDDHVQKESMIKWTQECIISSESMLNTAVETRVLGAQREILEHSNDKQIMIKLDTSSRFIIQEEKLCIYNPSPEQTPASISLIELLQN